MTLVRQSDPMVTSAPLGRLVPVWQTKQRSDVWN
jgi:hypothetical protein